MLTIRVEDQGPGIADLDRILAGQYKSQTGMGLGLVGARRLMDRFTIDTRPGEGTVVELRKLLPAQAPLLTPALVGDIGARLAALPTDATLTEVQQQNRELLNTLAELKARQEELLQLTRELEDTNRGVVALYAELDEKAGHLRRADEMKSRFLSNMSHEFRTPLNSIRALSKLLLDRVDGALTVEQEKQVSFILRGAEDLSELVNDLLDLAKIEAGKIDVRPGRFAVVRPVLRAARHAAAAAGQRIGAPGVRRGGRPAAAVHRRGQGVADPAQLHFQRAEVHRAGRGPGQRGIAGRRGRRCGSRCATPASASRKPASS